MIVIYKYPVPIAMGHFSAELPGDAEILQFAEQDGQVFFWAAVNTDAPLETHKFFGVGTGHPWPDDEAVYLTRYINTAHCLGGALVVHWFEIVAGEDEDGDC